MTQITLYDLPEALQVLLAEAIQLYAEHQRRVLHTEYRVSWNRF